jgi:ABC-2 type transport system permease protein
MINPILERELKTRMRSWKTILLLCGYLLLIGLIVFFSFLSTSFGYNYGNYGFNPQIVTTIYVVIAMFQLGLLIAILPVFTATSISGERERQTLDLLLCTNISPWKIIIGKMSAALSFVLLLILSAMPFLGIILLFGGVTLLDLLKIVLFYMATAVMVSSIGMFCTTHFKKNLTSIVMSYIILGTTYFAPLFTMGVGTIIMNAMTINNSRQGIIQFVEKYAYEILLFFFSSNPFYGMSSLINTGNSNSGFNILGMGGINMSTTLFRYVTPWMGCTFYFIIATALLLMLSKRRLTKLK